MSTVERALSLTAAAVTVVGSVLFLVAAFLPISFRVFPEPSPAKKLEFIQAALGQWYVSQVLFGAGAVTTALGIAIYAVSVRLESFAPLVWTSVALLAAGVVLWLWQVIARAADPERFAQGQSPAWAYLASFLLTEAGLIVLGVALLSSPLPAWVGWALIGYTALLAVLTLIFRDMPPFAFYHATLVVGVIMLFRFWAPSA